MSKNHYSSFEVDRFYHVFNRGNNKENIFRDDENYSFFLNKWDKYLSDYINVWSYCLMPNHFHFLIQVKGREQILKIQNIDLTGFENLPGLISNQFSKLFNSYTKSFNKTYNRTGSLFQKRFKRLKVDSDNYLLTLIHYIHHNPIHHDSTENYSDWVYSSYPAILSDKATKIDRDEVLNCFGGRSNFISIHEAEKNYKKIRHLIVE